MDMRSSGIKVATVCSGIGSPEQALKNLGIPHEITFACEIDKFARQTYLANFKPNMMLEDMTKETWEGEEYYSDLFIGGIPCQAFSLAGKRLGEMDPRGLLFYDFYRYVKIQQPKYFIIENVKGLLSDANGATFQNWIQLLGRSENTHINMFNHPDSLEYNLHWKVLNTKDFGLPQNRERVFIVGIRKDLPNTFRFPIGWRLTKRLKDVLQQLVDEKYYLSEKLLDWISGHREKRQSIGKYPHTGNDISGCITARYHKMGAEDVYIQEPICVSMRGRNPDNPSDRTTGSPTEQRLEANSQGIANTLSTVQKDNLILEAQALTPKRTEYGKKIRKKYEAGEVKAKRKAIQQLEPREDGITNTITSVQKDNLVLEQIGVIEGYEQDGRVYSDNGLSSTLDTKPLIETKQRIRRLTPLEAFRLQGFPDDFFYRSKEVNSDTQLYKQAGNTISVPVIQAILNKLLK